MTYKKKDRLESEAKWIKNLTYTVYKKPKRFYMSDNYKYDNPIKSGTLLVNENNVFNGEKADPSVITRYSFSISSATRKYISLIITSNIRAKIWCNKKLIDFGKICSAVLILPLNKGDNIIDVDVLCPVAPMRMQIRTEDVNSRAMFSTGSADNLALTKDRFLIYTEKTCMGVGDILEFIPLLLDQRQYAYRRQLKLCLKKHDNGQALLVRRVRFGKAYRIPLVDFGLDSHKITRIDLILSCKKRNGKKSEFRQAFYVGDIKNNLPALIEQAKRVAYETVWSQTRRDAILSVADRVESYSEDNEHLLPYLEMLQDMMKNDCLYTEGDRYISGTKRVFFHDDLDNAADFYRVTLPRNYDPKKEYSLFLVCSTREYNTYAAKLDNSGLDDVISVDVSVRGVTLGGYIGEAALLNALKNIMEVYRIDPDRIYIGGYSNGASAALAIAQAYPHLFAGVYALSGRAEKIKMCNLSNINTWLITSPEEVHYSHTAEMMKSSEINYNNIHLIELPCHNHQTLQCIWLNTNMLSKFFSERREAYPTSFKYYTDRNRHLQAYWIKIHSIKPTSKFCKLSVEASKKLINISVRGATGLTIELPPFVHRNQFVIRINGKEFEYSYISEKQLHFIHGTHGFRESVYPKMPELSYKGNGIIDVYMDPLSIVVPDSACDTIKKVANVMAHPHTNAAHSAIMVWYKTYRLNELLKNEKYFNRSLIVVGRDDSDFYKTLDKCCPIYTDDTGYRYKDVVVEGAYCCMQIFPNPWNSSKNILYITYNDENILQRNLFLRRMVLPSYIKGRHAYLNETALIFNGNEYFVLQTQNGEIKKVEK